MESISESTNKRIPSYLLIYRKIRDKITEKVYAPGERLPSKRVTAETEGVSVITVEHAYAMLEEEGYIEARQRSGYYVVYQSGHLFSHPEDTSAGSRNQMSRDDNRGNIRGDSRDDIKDTLKTARFTPPSTNESGPDSFPFPTFARSIRKVLSEYGEQLLVKSENFGTAELRTVLSSYLARSRGIYVPSDRIVIGAGAEYLYGLVVQMIGRDRLYGLENPSYSKIQKVYEANGAECDLLTMGSDGILSDELIRTKAGVLHVTPFHSYPTGITANASKRREYLDWAAAREAFIVEDDYDSEFTLSGKNVDTLYALGAASGTYPNPVIYINTFTRTIAPSMRLGYMILPGAFSEEFKERISFYSCTVSVIEQYVLAEFIKSGEFERHINRVRRQLKTSSARNSSKPL